MFYCIDPTCPFRICNECCLKDIQPVIPQHPLLGPHHPLLVLPMHPHALIRVQQTNCCSNCHLGKQHYNSNCLTKNHKKYNMYGIVYACCDCDYDICERCMLRMLKDLEAGMEDPLKSNYFLKISEHPHILFKTKSPYAMNSKGS